MVKSDRNVRNQRELGKHVESRRERDEWEGGRERRRRLRCGGRISREEEEEGDALFLPLGFCTDPNILTAEARNNHLTQLPFIFFGNFAWVLCFWKGCGRG